MILLGKDDKGGCQSDLDIATRLAGHLTGSFEETLAYVNWLWERTRNELSLPWHQQAIGCLAKILLEHKHVGYRKARRIIKEAINNYHY